MLPSYSESSATERALARISKMKGENWLGRRPILRWVTLACVVIGTLLFFTHPVSLSTIKSYAGYEEDLLVNPGPASGKQTTAPSPPSATGPSRPELGSSALWDARKEEVRQTFLHAWRGYMSKAFPNDEVLPISGRNSNKYVRHRGLMHRII